jgi:Ni/Co efflux regulator RcnB
VSTGPQGPDPDDPTFSRRPRASDPEYAPPPSRPSAERFDREAGEEPGYGERRGSGDRPRYRDRERDRERERSAEYDERSEYEERGRYGRAPRRERSAEAAAFARRHLRTPETKEFFATSEFAVWMVTLVAIVIAGAIADNFPSWRVWLYVTILSAAYILSRGLAKAGARRDDTDVR